MPVRPTDLRWKTKTARGPSDVLRFIEQEFDQTANDRADLQRALSDLEGREVVYKLWGKDADDQDWEAKLTIQPAGPWFELSTETKWGHSMGEILALGTDPVKVLMALKPISHLDWELVSTYKR